MTDRDLDALSVVLAGMSLEAIQSLKNDDLWWLPILTDMTQPQAIVSIRLAIVTFNTYRYRAQCLAWLYCRLAQRRALRPWHLFRVGIADAPFSGAFILHDKLVTVWQSLRGHAMAVKYESSDIIYACLLGVDGLISSQEHDVVCLIVHRSQPELFLYVKRNLHFATYCLKCVLQEHPSQGRDDYIGELRHAFARAS